MLVPDDLKTSQSNVICNQALRWFEQVMTHYDEPKILTISDIKRPKHNPYWYVNNNLHTSLYDNQLSIKK